MEKFRTRRSSPGNWPRSCFVDRLLLCICTVLYTVLYTRAFNKGVLPDVTGMKVALDPIRRDGTTPLTQHMLYACHQRLFLVVVVCISLIACLGHDRCAHPTSCAFFDTHPFAPDSPSPLSTRPRPAKTPPWGPRIADRSHRCQAAHQ